MGTSYYGVGDCIDDQAGGARHGTHWKSERAKVPSEARKDPPLAESKKKLAHQLLTD
jgi:hypothetical protein